MVHDRISIIRTAISECSIIGTSISFTLDYLDNVHSYKYYMYAGTEIETFCKYPRFPALKL